MLLYKIPTETSVENSSNKLALGTNSSKNCWSEEIRILDQICMLALLFAMYEKKEKKT